jgi:hypothetical protein
MKNYDNVFERLMNYADNMKIIDTHEHLQPHSNYCGEQPDVLCDYFSHYITTDLFSAGMPVEDLEKKVCNFKIDINERFKMLEPYLEQVKNTSYYRSLEIAAKKIHKINGISIRTIEELNEKFKKAASREDYGRYIMKDLCNIEISVNDNWSGDMKWSTTDLFVPTFHFSAEKFTENMPFDEYCEYHRNLFMQKKADGMKTIKNAMAYERSLYFEDVSYSEAKEVYEESAKKYFELKKETPDKEPEFSIPKKLEDYIAHVILKAADETNFIIQIHTGLQEGMNHNLEDSNPMLLKNLFTKYPNLTFDIFHMGYPYERELMVLAKTHRNVYIDLCWAHIISPYAAKNAFYEMLDVLPYTKICGFGGDYVFFDGVAGHITLAKQNICEVLAKKVCGGECGIDLAEKILQAVLHDNAKRIFSL